jgi:hypothetical protein
MSSNCIGVRIGRWSKRFRRKLLWRRNGDDLQRQECALLDNAGYAADLPGRAGGRAGQRFFSWRNLAKKRNSKLNFLKRTDFGGF